MNRNYLIPFIKPQLGRNDIRAVSEAINKNCLIGNGHYEQLVRQKMSQWLHTSRIALTPSCSAALELSMLLVGIGPGDEVILPSFTFVSTANAIILRGATPIFADCNPQTMNLDPNDVAKRITRKTKAIVTVHYAGVPCEMDAFKSLASKHHLMLIEDAAQAFGSKYRGKPAGTLGDIGCFSFHGTKNITCGEGGAITTSSDKHFKHIEILRENGTDRAAFLQGKVSEYVWQELGTNCLMSDILAAILFEQLKKYPEIINARKLIYRNYLELLKPLEQNGLIKLPYYANYFESNYHFLFFFVHSRVIRNKVLAFLRKNGIQATFHFIPLHLSPFARTKYGYEKGSLPTTEKLSNCLIRLPLYPGLNDSDLRYIVKNIEVAVTTTF